MPWIFQYYSIAEVRLEAEEQGEMSVFQWQDMLKDNLMLQSLYRHKYLNTGSGQGGLCSANATGARPNHKEGACFSWEIVTEGD